VEGLNLSVKAKIGKKRTLVIPKAIAETLNIDEESKVKITVLNDKIVIKPLRDAIWLSLHGEKLANLTLEDLEEESIEQQKKISED